MLVKRGTIEFLCKHFSEEDDDDLKEEILLCCIALLLGGNKQSQDTFFSYMVSDKNNLFIEKVFKLLIKYFDQTKKFLTEKNAKLEVTYKIRTKNALKRKEF